jgi:hypothetical protein
MAGESYPVRQRESARAEFTPPLLVSDLHYSQWKAVPEKALTISGADRFSSRGGTCRLHAIFMNQLSIIWGHQDDRVNLFYYPLRARGVEWASVSAEPRGSLATRGVAPKQHGGPRVNLFSHPYAREGADGQAVVCPLLRGRSPTRGVAPKQHRGLRRAFSPAFRAGSLYPLAPGCRRIWRGEVWKYGFGGAVADFVLVISGSRRRPRRSPVRGQLRHDPIATAG